MTLRPTYKRIMDISPYVPGKSSASKGGGESIKLSSNENPFGCSEKARQAIKDSLDNIHRYPEGSCILLREKLSELFGCDENRTIFGAGSDELITLICMAFAAGENNEVLYPEYGFLMYPISAMSVGAKPVTANEVGLKADVSELIKKVNENTKVIFVANPNNPTGSYIEEAEIRKLMDSVPSDIIVVLDCAYYEYALPFENYPDAMKLADEYSNLVVLRTFSKAYGLPSLRLGWAYASQEVIDILNRVRGPFNVNGLAQAAGLAALEDQEFISNSVKFNSDALSYMAEEYSSLGLKTYPSVANFILVDFGSESKAADVDSALKERGVTGRVMKAYNLPTCMRFNIGLEEENKILLNSLKEIV